MGRIIINYDEDIDIKDAMLSVFEVIKLGRISHSNTTYSLCSKFKDGTVVLAERTPVGSDRFNVSKEKAGGNNEN